MIGQIVIVVGIQRPFDGRYRQVCAATATEHAQRVNQCLWCDARANAQRVKWRGAVVRTGKWRAVSLDATTCGGRRYVRTVTVAIHRIRVGRGRVTTCIRITCKVSATYHARTWKERVNDGTVIGLIVREQPGAAKRGVLIVDARVDNANANALTRDAQWGCA